MIFTTIETLFDHTKAPLTSCKGIEADSFEQAAEILQNLLKIKFPGVVVVINHDVSNRKTARYNICVELDVNIFGQMPDSPMEMIGVQVP